jgi:hypothetical protein
LGVYPVCEVPSSVPCREPGGEPLQLKLNGEETEITKGPVPAMSNPMVGVVLPQVRKLVASRNAWARLPVPEAFVFVTQKTGVGEGGGTAVHAAKAWWAASTPASAAASGVYREREFGRERRGVRIKVSLGYPLGCFDGFKRGLCHD